MGVYDFGDGDNDYSSALDIRQFLQIAQEEDLLVILRPGPYICGEWDFGGLPRYVNLLFKYGQNIETLIKVGCCGTLTSKCAHQMQIF